MLELGYNRASGETILVIDDNRDNLCLMDEILEGENYNVICVDSGSAGIEVARAQRPDCIILDVQMPSMDGFEVCRRLKLDEETRDTPILFLTAENLDEGSVVRGLNAGAQDYLLKPFNYSELIARIKVLLRIKKAEDTLRAAYCELEKAREKVLANQRLETVRQVVATLAHELNQPLTAVVGNAEILAMDIDEPDASELVGAILREANRMAQVVQRLAEATRVEVKPYIGDLAMISVEG
jgi:DNA-binding response OmpR family regulator